MNIRGFQGFRQDKGEVRTATGAACSLNRWSRDRMSALGH